MIPRPFSASHLRTLSFSTAFAVVAAVGFLAAATAPRDAARNAGAAAGPRVGPTPPPPTVALTTAYGFTPTNPNNGTNADGTNPSTLIPDGTGSFLSVASNGGTDAFGTVFRTGPDGSFSTLHSFTSDGDGSFPGARLTADGQGNFYGTTGNGGAGNTGTIYEIAADGTYSLVYSFPVLDGNNFNATGANPEAPLVPDGQGNFYGTANNGGASGNGTVYRLNANGSVDTIFSFTNVAPVGSSPRAGLVAAGNGNFIGLTAEGGLYGNGTVYEVTPAGGYITLYSFSTNTSDGTITDGVSPDSALVTDGQGSFYGVAPLGGVNQSGTVFKFTTDGTAAGSTLTPIYSFSSLSFSSNLGQGTNQDGANPQASLIYGLDGNLYGTTENGGTSAEGTIFELSTDGTVFQTLYTFTGGNDGGQPSTSLFQANTTDFYGTTRQIVSNVDFRSRTAPVRPEDATSNGYGTVFHLSVVPAAGILATDQSGYNAVNENVGNLTFEVTRFGGSTGAVTVPYTTADGAAKAGIDYAATSGVLSWADGDTAPKTFTIPIIDRHITGTGFVSFFVNLGQPTGGAVLTGSSNTFRETFVRILDNDAATPTPVPAPVISSSAAASGQVGVAFSYQIVASNAPTAYTASGLPTGLALNGATGLISGTPTVAGRFTAVLNAANAGGSAAESVTFTIAAATITTPVITSAASASASVGSPFAYQITATNNPTSFGTSTLPEGLNVNITTGLISGMPTTAGSYTVRLFAANAGGTSTATLQLAVTTSQSQPTLAITSPPDGITVVVGEQVPLAASITDPDSTISSVQFLVNGQVVGTSSASGPFTSSAPAPAPGTYTLSAVATDAAGRTFSGTVHVIVIAADPNNPAPTADLLTPVNARDIASNATLTLTATADAVGTAGLDHVSILVDGQVIAMFDATGKLLSSAHGGGPVRQDASSTPLSKLFSTTYQMPGLDKILTMIVAATDKLGHTSVSPVSSFHSKVTTDRAPKVSFANASALQKVLVGSLNPVHITGSDPDAGGTSAVTGRGPVRQDAASDATLAQLEYWINGANVAKAVASATLDYSFTPPAIGKYVFHAVATDASGLATVSDPVVLEADAAPPIVTAVVSGDGMARLGEENGKVAIRRTGDLSAALTVRYKVAGSAIKGVNYKTGPLTGLAVIPAGATQVKVKIKPLDTPTLPLGSLTVAKVKLLPSLDGSYTLGTPAVGKIKIIDNE